jgi:hypothetical protein
MCTLLIALGSRSEARGALPIVGVRAQVHAYERYLALDPKARDAEKVRRRIRRLREGGVEIRKPS